MLKIIDSEISKLVKIIEKKLGCKIVQAGDKKNGMNHLYFPSKKGFGGYFNEQIVFLTSQELLGFLKNFVLMMGVIAKQDKGL